MEAAMTARAEAAQGTGLFCVVDDDGPVEEINAFLRAVTTRGLSPLTVRAYAFDLAAAYRWMAADGRTLSALTRADLHGIVAHERTRGASPASINRRLVALRLLHRFWHPHGMSNAAGTSQPSPHYRGRGRDRRLGVHVLKRQQELVLRVKQPQKLVTPLSGEQVRAFLRSLRHYRDIAMVHLMLLCGLRSREVLGLKLGDVSLLDRRVRVMGKGAKERVVPLADLAVVSVEQYFKHERPGVCADDTLFVCLKGARRGRPMTPAGLRSIFRSRRRLGALANANPHRFRHTFGADMARSGVSLSVLQRLMGHGTPEQTLQYINLSMADVADAYRAAVAEIQKRYDPEVQDAAHENLSAQAREDLPLDP
jgi:site-specific recombinase XerD